MAAVRDTSPEQIAIRVPLKVKLSLLITALVVLTVTLVSVFLLRQEQQSLTAEMTKRGLTIAENLAAARQDPAHHQRRADAQRAGE